MYNNTKKRHRQRKRVDKWKRLHVLHSIMYKLSPTYFTYFT